MAKSHQDESTDAPSPTSPQPTLPGLDSVTSSPGSADGHWPAGSQDYPTMRTSGPGHAHAKGSPTRARGAGFSTLDIFGQHGSHSSQSVSLQSSLESRLRQRLASSGSILFVLTWNDAVTPSGRRICALRASARPTSASACSSWPTPTVSRGDYSYARGDHDNKTLKLAGAAKLASWPTPQAADADRGGQAERCETGRSNLRDFAHLATWATPSARDWKSSASNMHGVNSRPLNEARLLATSGPPATGSPAPTESRGQLNPEHTRWLQGYPAGWGSYADTATRSSRK